MQKPSNTYGKSKQDWFIPGRKIVQHTNYYNTENQQTTGHTRDMSKDRWKMAKAKQVSMINTLHKSEAERNFLNQLKAFITSLKLTSSLLVKTNVFLLRSTRENTQRCLLLPLPFDYVLETWMWTIRQEKQKALNWKYEILYSQIQCGPHYQLHL